MSAPIRVGGFAVVVAGLTLAAYGVGNAVGPVAASSTRHAGDHSSKHADAGHAADAPPVGAVPAGLQSTEAGYSLALERDVYRPGSVAVRFTVTDSEGAAVTEYEYQHGKRLHLIVVRRDLSSFQHLHPRLSPTGEWSVDLDLRKAGDYRVFADFKPAGAERGYTLGRDLSVAGHYAPTPLPNVETNTTVDDYQVSLDGDLVAGTASHLTLTVSRDGRPVTDLEPYLEAFGHLVVLRDGDLAYLHVHPDGAPGDGTRPGPDIKFVAEVPSTGTYRLFLDFKHDDVVRTAAFTARTTDTADEPTTEPDHDEHPH